jgi:hypothetical protein
MQARALVHLCTITKKGYEFENENVATIKPHVQSHFYTLMDRMKEKYTTLYELW